MDFFDKMRRLMQDNKANPDQLLGIAKNFSRNAGAADRLEGSSDKQILSHVMTRTITKLARKRIIELDENLTLEFNEMGLTVKTADIDYDSIPWRELFDISDDIEPYLGTTVVSDDFKEIARLHKIKSIKAVREAFSLGLKEAKLAVDYIIASYERTTWEDALTQGGAAPGFVSRDGCMYLQEFVRNLQ